MEIVSDRERRAPALQRQTRLQYQKLLGRTLQRSFPDWNVEGLVSTADLERSFSPVYTRGLLRRGRSTVCALGVNDSELQASVDGALTFALLWFHYCRERDAARSVIEALRLFVPRGRSAVVQARMHYLNRVAFRFELFEFDERGESLEQLDLSDQGNIATRLVRCPETNRVKERFNASAERIRTAVPECESVVLSATELAFRLHGLEFARVRVATTNETFARGEEIVFGSGAHETLLTEQSEPLFEDLMRRLRELRRTDGDKKHALWRMQPERWLESEVKKNVTVLDARLDPCYAYAQVPAFAASDRGMIDLLASTREGQLAVIELKADEDIHLPLQGLDYWSRVKWHHEREDFHRFGYFVSQDGKPLTLSPRAPLLLLVAPALRIHPATDTILRYLSPELDWTLIAVDERWRDEVKVVFRKRVQKRSGDRGIGRHQDSISSPLSS
ncbi:MAG TPA: hypothetical protein VNX88_15595 [Terriglobales bacterium]|nr:hypothetical protein [Terriglobales bacterium]